MGASTNKLKASVRRNATQGLGGMSVIKTNRGLINKKIIAKAFLGSTEVLIILIILIFHYLVP